MSRTPVPTVNISVRSLMRRVEEAAAEAATYAAAFTTNVLTATTAKIGAGGTLGTVEKLRVGTPTTVDNTANISVTPSTTAAKGLVVQGLAGQTANVIEIQGAAGTPTLAATLAGALTHLSTALNQAGSFLAVAVTPAAAGLVRLGTAGAIAWRNTANTADIVGIKAGGPSSVVELGGAAAPVFIGSALAGTAGVSEKLRVNTPTTSVAVATTIITPGATNEKPVVVQGLAGQTGNLIDCQDSTGATLAATTAAGGLHLAAQSTAPAVPASGLMSLHARTRGGRPLLHLVDPLGQPQIVASAPWITTGYQVSPNTTTTMRGTGVGTHATTGTVSHVAATTLVPYSSLFTTAATAAASSAVNTTSLFRRGTAGDINGGFEFVGHLLLADASYDKGAASTGSRIRIGITNSTTMATSLGTDHAPAANSQAMFVRDHTDGVTDVNWQFVTSNGGSATVTDTGVVFARNAVMRFRVWCPLGSATIHWGIENLTAGTAEVTGTVTATLPAAASNLYAGAGILTIDAVARTMTIPAPGIFAQADKG